MPGSPGSGMMWKRQASLPVSRVVGGDEPADAVLAARHADDHLVLHHQRRHGQRIAERVVRHLRVPDRLAALRVDGHEVRVERAHEQRVAEDRDAAIDLAAADAKRRRQHVVIDPEHAAGLRIERHDVVGRLRQVHDAVDDERRGFERLQRLRLKHPLQLEVLRVGGRDLLQRAVALAHVGAGIGQPVLRLAGGLRKALGGDLGTRRPRRISSETAKSSRARHPAAHSDPTFQRDEVTDDVRNLLLRQFVLVRRHAEVFSTVNSRTSLFISDTSCS